MTEAEIANEAAPPKSREELVAEAFAAGEAADEAALTPPEPEPDPKAKAKKPETPDEAKAKLSKQHAAITRRERELKNREARATQIEQASAARVRELEGRFESLAKMDEHQILEEIAKQRGVTMDVLVKRAIARVAGKGKLPPDEEARLQVEGLSQKVERLEREKAAHEQAEQQARQRGEESDAASHWLASTLELAKASAEELPLLTTLYTEAELTERVRQVTLAAIDQQGVVPEQDDVLLYLERLERDAEEHRAQKLGARTPPKAQAQAGAEPGPKRPEPAPSARTLTNTAASQRATQFVPPRTERERIAWAAEAIPD